MTAAAIYSQYRRPPPKRDPDARDGHITEFDRKMAARGEDMRDFPESSWATPDWHNWKNGSKLQPILQIPPPPPSPATHTRRWLNWYDGFSSRRSQQQGGGQLMETTIGGPPSPPK